MARRTVSLLVGLLAAGLVFGFMTWVSLDVRIILALGFALTLAAGVWNGGRPKADLLDALTLGLPLSAAFAVIVLPELPGLWPHCFFYLVAAPAGHLWRRRAPAGRAAATAGLVGVIVVTAGYGAFYLPGMIARALTHDRNEPAPAIALQTLAGAAIPSRDWQGKVVVLDFFATYCGPCIAELPRLDEIETRLAGRKDVVLLVVGGESGGETEDSLRAFAERSGGGLTFAWDPGSRAHDALGLHGVPGLVVLDPAGRLRRVHQGYNAAETGFSAELVAFIDRLSAGA